MGVTGDRREGHPHTEGKAQEHSCWPGHGSPGAEGNLQARPFLPSCLHFSPLHTRPCSLRGNAQIVCL